MAEYIGTEIPIMKIDINAEPDMKVKSKNGNIYNFAKQTMACAEGVALLEDFGAGETMTWFFPEPELMYVLKGKAEMTYSVAATSHAETKTVNIEAGDCYIIPSGGHVTWKVAPGSPLRRLCVVMPFPQRAIGLRPASAVEKLKPAGDMKGPSVIQPRKE